MLTCRTAAYDAGSPRMTSGSEKTWDTIDEAIRLRDKVLLILSEASIASDWAQGSPHFIPLNQELVLRRGKRASFWADLSDRSAKWRQDDGRPRRKRPA